MDVRGERFAVEVGRLLAASRHLEPDDLLRLAVDTARELGAVEVELLIADYGQTVLVPLDSAAPTRPIDGSMAGRAYVRLCTVASRRGPPSLWLPLVDGGHRLGVLHVVLRAGEEVEHSGWEAFATAVGRLVPAVARRGDAVHRAARRDSVHLRAETQVALLPPLTLSSPRVSVSGILHPPYQVAGDAFDYALNGDLLHVCIVDGMGHTLRASLIAAVVVAAVRNARRAGEPLQRLWETAQKAVELSFQGEVFATGLFAEVDLVDGRLRLACAGHPPPLILRGRKRVRMLEPEAGLPLGIEGAVPGLLETRLEPGDRLVLFTDGVVEARSATGEPFTEARLVDALERETASGLPPPEVLRRVMRRVMAFEAGRVGDDCTLVLVEWHGAAHSLGARRPPGGGSVPADRESGREVGA